MKLARCARSDSHSVRALRAVKSHPCRAGLHSNGRGAAPVLIGSFSGDAVAGTFQNVSMHFARAQMRRRRVKYAGAAPHPSRIFPACPWKIWVAASASPLFVLFVRRRCGDRRVIYLSAHDGGIFVSHASRASLMLMFLFMTKRAHIR